MTGLLGSSAIDSLSRTGVRRDEPLWRARSPPDPAGFRRLPLGAASVAVCTARDVTGQVAAHDSLMEVPDRIGYSFGHAAAGIQICAQVYLWGNVYERVAFNLFVSNIIFSVVFFR